MIELRGVGVRFGAVAALDGLDLSFAPGRTTALIGESGSGKSTILRLSIGLIAPTTGEVLFDGRPIDDWTPVRRRVGYVVQDGGLFPHLTARDNALLVGRHLRRPVAELARRLSDLCAMAKLPESALDRYPAQLSGGQQQRVALVRALLLEPDALLLDEPLAALDPLVRASLQDDLATIFRAAAPTVVFVTHDMAEAAFLADEIVLLRDGRIVQRGSVDDLRERPADEYVTQFLRAQRKATF